MNTSINNFQDFSLSTSLTLEYASPNENEGYLNLFSYDGENKREYCMYLYGENQFDTVWEYEYHDCLTIGRKLLDPTDKVLILGSGDLMNHRFLGSYDVDLIDIDPLMTHLAQSHPLMLQLNQYTPSQNYHIHNMDALDFMTYQQERLHEYNYIVLDFPVMISPVNDEVKKFGLEKFFSKEIFVDSLLKNLAYNGLITMQADDTLVHVEHKKYFQTLIEGTGLYFHMYSIDFLDSTYKQYFYMFTKNENIYEKFKKISRPMVAKPGLFRKDDYFTSLFESWQDNIIDYAIYKDVLSGK